MKLEHIVSPKGMGGVTGHKGKLLKRCHGLHIEVEQTNPQGVSALLVPRTKRSATVSHKRNKLPFTVH
jgi:hypothetical protein